MNTLSVVIPTRGRHHFLRQALESVVSQDYPPQEILVVDDGTGAAEAVGGIHPLIAVLDNRQRGPVAARNMGVAHASGESIVFLDDDDWFTGTGYFGKAALAIARGAAFCFCDGQMMFEDQRPPLPYAFDADAETLTRDNTILISGVVYRRALHETLGVFDERLPFYWDWDWYLRVARAGHALVRIRSPAVAIRVHARNMSGESLETQRRANLGAFAAKHGLAPIPLKNHLDIATHAPGIAPTS